MDKNVEYLMEVITVRLNTSGDIQAFQEILRELAKASEEELKTAAVKIYKSEQVENDWAIYLWYPEVEKNGKSSLATNLTEAIHSFGLGHHKIWRHYNF